MATLPAAYTRAKAGFGKRVRPNAWGLLVLPGAAFLLLFFFVPVGGMILRSLTDPSPENYLDFFRNRLFLRSLGYTLEVAGGVTAICLVLGYAWAYQMRHSGRRMRALMFALIVLPFWSSLLVRTYAWTVILRETGIANQILMGLHLAREPVELMGNTTGVIVGMVQLLLPFMVFPLFASMSQVDDELVKAALSLGARPLVAFIRVYLPLTLPGIFAGCLLVFVVALGFYITPTVLGSAHSPMISQAVVTQTTILLNFGLGSAMAVILLVLSVLVIGIGSRFVNINQALGLAES